MNAATTVIIAVLVFGFLIFIHEFGHYITARIFKVRIEEFSIGMGPRLVSFVSKKTDIRYSIALLPIGGYVSMPGENGEDSELADDPDTFDKKPAWQRFIITAAGATVNIVAGFLAMIILTSMINVGNTTVRGFYRPEDTGYEVSSYDGGLRHGDEIIAVDGKRVYIYDELSYEIMRRGHEPVDITVIRDGARIVLYDVVFPKEEESGQIFGAVDFAPEIVDKDPLVVLKFSWHKSVLIVRMCLESIADLISGRYTFAAVSGPVGISSAIGDAAEKGFKSLLYIVVLISINLGFMNLLPIPALDGGRLFTIIIEMITRRRLPPKVEGIINGVGLILLLALSVVIMIKDVFQLIVV